MDASEVLRSEAAREFRAPNGVTEDNWKSRMHFCNTMADAISTYGKGSDRHPKDFPAQIEPYLNNILECAVSERTQLSNAACKLLGNLPKVLEKDMLHHLDRILPVLIKLCANTKAVTVKIAALAVSNIVSESGFNPRLLFWVCGVFEEKAVKPKEHGTVWIRTILSQYVKYMTYKDFEMMGHAIQLGLEDADANVRTNSRAAYWTYYKADTEGAEAIMDKLNPQAKKALQNDPNNPDKKSATSAAKQPERPKSALAQIKKDKLKRAQEALTKNKTLSTSTASHDGIEVHEPRNSKMDKPKRVERPPLPTAAPVEEPVARESKHKKVPSQEEPSRGDAAKGNNRLLSAPVRRPRINVMPMSAPQNARPSSRTGHVPPPREHPREHTREPSKDARPTSSSSSKSISTPAPAPPSKIATSPRQRGTTPGLRAAYIPDGKENDAVATRPHVGPKTSPPVEIPEPKAQPQQISPVRKPRKAEVKPPMPAAQSHVATHMHPADHVHIKEVELGREIAKHPFNRMLNPYDPDVFQGGNPDTRLQKLGPPITSGAVDLATGQRFLSTILPKLQNINPITEVAEDVDPLGYRKLKNIVQQHPTELITNEETFSELMNALLQQLWCRDELQNSKRTDLTVTTNPVYSRQVILQITVSLLSGYPTWSFTWHPFWLCCMILYRCTFETLENQSHGAQYIHKNIDTVVYTFPNPLDLIDSVYYAIEEGERAITKDPDFSLDKERPSRSSRTKDNSEIFGSLDTEHTAPGSVSEKYSYDPYTVRGQWMHVAEKKGITPEAFEHYLKRAMNEQNTYDTEHNNPQHMPKKACLLWETGLQCLTLILQQAKEMQETLEARRADMLGHIATHCLKSYDAQIKRSVIPFVKALYMIMMDDEKFFSYFQEESERNLLEYYLVSIRGKAA